MDGLGKRLRNGFGNSRTDRRGGFVCLPVRGSPRFRAFRELTVIARRLTCEIHWCKLCRELILDWFYICKFIFRQRSLYSRLTTERREHSRSADRIFFLNGLRLHRLWCGCRILLPERNEPAVLLHGRFSTGFAAADYMRNRRALLLPLHRRGCEKRFPARLRFRFLRFLPRGEIV